MAYPAKRTWRKRCRRRNVVLTDHHESLIASLVDSGRYQNASEVLREGLRLVETREAEDAAKLDALREAVRIGDEAFERGDYKTFAETDKLIAYLTEKTEDVSLDRLRIDIAAMDGRTGRTCSCGPA